MIIKIDKDGLFNVISSWFIGYHKVAECTESILGLKISTIGFLLFSIDSGIGSLGTLNSSPKYERLWQVESRLMT